MHPAPTFRVEDQAALLAFLRQRPFVTLCAAVGGAPLVAQAPVVVGGTDDQVVVDFHLSRGSVLAPHLTRGFRAIVLAAGPDAYISPDWYESADQVPTWNYLSVEAEGFVAPLSDAELVAQLDALSAQEEARLAPKRPWTRGKMDQGKFQSMLKGIVGARMTVERLQGTWKLSQNKTDADRLGAAAGLGEHPLAGMMREA